MSNPIDPSNLPWSAEIPPMPPVRRKRFYKRWWFRILAIIVISAASYDIATTAKERRKLREAVEEMDRLFQGDWRLEDVLAKMPEPTPREKNPFVVVMELKGEELAAFAEFREQTQIVFSRSPQHLIGEDSRDRLESSFNRMSR